MRTLVFVVVALALVLAGLALFGAGFRDGGLVVGAGGLAAGAVVTVLVARRVRAGRRARARAEWGDHAGAARLFVEAGNLLAAARSYARAGEATMAARLLLQLERGEELAFSVVNAKGAELAAATELLQEAGALADSDLAKAVSTALAKDGQMGRAAAALEASGDVARAKDLRRRAASDLASSGRGEEAAEAYLALGEEGLAAFCLADLARRSDDKARRSRAGRRAAELFARAGHATAAAEALADAGDLDEATRILREAGDHGAAARLLLSRGAFEKARAAFEAVGDLRQAAVAAREGGDVEGAADLFENAGDAVEAARVLLGAGLAHEAAQVHLRSGSAAQAADVLAGAGLVAEARDVLVASGDLDGAVELLVRLGRHRDAAEVLRSRGEERRAAVLLARSGDLLSRARLLEGEGDHAGAAQAYMDLGRARDARDVLAALERPSDQDRFLLGRALMALGDADGAVHQFARLIERPGEVPRTDALYGLGRALEAAERPEEACVAFEELSQADSAYRDAAFRLRMLRARQSGASHGPASPPANEWTNPTHVRLPAEWGVVPAEAPVGAGDVATAGPSQVQSVAPRGGDVPAGMTGIPSRYRIEREVGRGGMGVVYRALDTTLMRPVALKVLLHAVARDNRVRELFKREAQAVARLVHPNIVTLFDAGWEGTQPYLVFEFLEGASLRCKLSGPLTPAEAAAVGARVADALAYAHSRGIVHRDVKPENVVITIEGAAKLTDFGVAHMVAEESAETKNAVVGTPGYMAPEQIAGGEIGPWTDVYSLGAMLFECATGRLPFVDGDPMFHHVYTQAPDPRSVYREVPDAAAELILACMAKDAKSRPGSAAEVASRLRDLLR